MPEQPAFYFLATSEPNLLNLVMVISFDNFAGGFASTAFIAYLSGLTDKSYTATQYALFSSLMTLPESSSQASRHTGRFIWVPRFFIFSALGLPGILMVSWLFYVNQQLKELDV